MNYQVVQKSDGKYYVVDDSGNVVKGPFSSELTASLSVPDSGSSTSKLAGLSESALLSGLKDGSLQEQDVRDALAAMSSNGAPTYSKDAIDYLVSQNQPEAPKPAYKTAAGPPTGLVTNVNAPADIKTEADAVKAIKAGRTSLEQAYNALVIAGESPQAATNALIDGGVAPNGWTPNLSAGTAPQQQQPADTTANNGLIANLEGAFKGAANTAQAAQQSQQTSYPAGSWQAYAAQAAQKAGLPPSDVVNLLQGEGAGAIDPTSGATWGILPSTAKGMGTTIEAIRADPHLAIDTAVQYLASNAPMFGGDVQKTLASYFIGAGNVQKAEQQAQQNGTDWLTEANKIASQYGQGTVSDFFASHNLGGSGGALTASAGGADTTQDHWVTNADGTTSFVKGVPKSAMTLQEQQAANLAAKNAETAQSQAAIGQYVMQHPGAKVFAMPQSGQYRIEDENGNTFSAAFDNSTGQLVQQYEGRTPGGAPNMPQFQGTPAQRALLAQDPQLADATFAAQFGHVPSLSEKTAWLGTSTADRMDANLTTAANTVADTGKLPNSFAVGDQNSTYNQGLRYGANLLSGVASTGTLTPNEQSIYGLDPNIFRGKPDYTLQNGQDQIPGYSLIPASTVDAQAASRVAGEVRSGALSNTPSNISLADERALGQLNNDASQNGGAGDVTQTADWQRGYSDGQSDEKAASPNGNTPASMPTPQGSAAYVAGYQAGWGAGEAARVQSVNNNFNDQFTKQYGQGAGGPQATPAIASTVSAGPPSEGSTGVVANPPPVVNGPPPANIAPVPKQYPFTPVLSFATGGAFMTPPNEKLAMVGMRTGKVYSVAGDNAQGGVAPEEISVTPMSGMASTADAMPLVAAGPAKYRFSGFK